MEHPKDSAKSIQHSKSRAELDVWLACIGSSLNFGNCAREPVSIQNTEGRFLWNDKRCPSQCSHNDFPSTSHKSPGIFMITARFKPTSLILCHASCKFLFTCGICVRPLCVLCVWKKVDIPV